MRKFAIILLWLSGISVVFWSGSLSRTTQHYPWEGVLFFGAVLTVEISILSLILRLQNYYRSWGRALAATVIFAGVSMFWAMGALHQPTYYKVHVYWLFTVDLSILALLIASWMNPARRAEQRRSLRSRTMPYES